MTPPLIYLLLADDDQDDRLFFKEALDELSLSINLTTVNNGEELMELLTKKNKELPAIIFLDLNMPRKNGMECLTEIKQNKNLKTIPVIIFSTAFDTDIMNQLYHKGAQHYICKPTDFSKLKKVINDALKLTLHSTPGQPDKDHFLLQP